MNIPLMRFTPETSQSPIGPCAPLEQSPVGDVLIHSLTAAWSSFSDCGVNAAVSWGWLGLNKVRVTSQTHAQRISVIWPRQFNKSNPNKPFRLSFVYTCTKLHSRRINKSITRIHTRSTGTHIHRCKNLFLFECSNLIQAWYDSNDGLDDNDLGTLHC